ncbi:MAG: HlyD family type I secretion periplasmic adaptor subunit [Magnetococcales bacterium]|nr:HlyD family type I secretion periplasmic adaptor subunit [Magnetococcales bacterium]
MNPLPFGEYERSSSIGSQVMLLGMIGVFLALLAWSHWGALDVLSITQGEVIPSSQIKKIQHLEGGIVREIKVHEGELVQREQPLLELESVSSGADVGELRSRILATRAEIRRLEAEAQGREQLQFTPEEKKELGIRVRQAEELFATRRLNLKNTLASQAQAVVQRQKDVQEIQARLHHAERKLALVKEQVGISEKLLKSDINNRYNHLDLLKEFNTLQSRIDEDTAALDRAEAQVREAHSNMKVITSKYDEEVGKLLETARRDLNEYQARMGKFEDSVRRTVVKSPVRGVVKTLYVATLGGVVKAGETIVDIVPDDDKLVIEAKLSIHDIGYVAVGQIAKVRLTSTDAARFGHLQGRVVTISPDTYITKEGSPFYKVRIETNETQFTSRGQTYRLVSGMILQVSILTGSRTVLEYIISPLFNAMHSALGER